MTSLAAASQLHLLLPISLTTAACAAFFQFGLTALVIQQRMRAHISLLDGGDAVLTRRIRAHANFTENLPIVLLLMLLLELAGWTTAGLIVSAVAMGLARSLHVVGILKPSAMWARKSGMLLTMFVMFTLAVAGAWMLLKAA